MGKGSKKNINDKVDKIDQILKNEYVPEYIPIDNIIPQIDELVNNILEKKQVILEMKKENSESDQSSKDIEIIAKDINRDLFRIAELQKSQLEIDFSKMDSNEKFALMVRCGS